MYLILVFLVKRSVLFFKIPHYSWEIGYISKLANLTQDTAKLKSYAKADVETKAFQEFQKETSDIAKSLFTDEVSDICSNPANLAMVYKTRIDLHATTKQTKC